jgi:carbon-monoxide dehydrogenase small subunit
MNRIPIKFRLNDVDMELDVDIMSTLLDVIREEIGITGTKRGCEVGECGACTVIMGGMAVNACMVLAPQVQGKAVWTVEGLNRDGQMDVLQKAFLQEHAVQCGFCTPGMLMSARALLLENPDPSEQDIRVAISGNLCRCTGYLSIIKAIRSAAATIAAEEN